MMPREPTVDALMLTPVVVAEIMTKHFSPPEVSEVMKAVLEAPQSFGLMSHGAGPFRCELDVARFFLRTARGVNSRGMA